MSVSAVLMKLLHPSGFHVLWLGLHPPSRHSVEVFDLPWFDPQRLCRFQVWFIILLCQLLLSRPKSVSRPISCISFTVWRSGNLKVVKPFAVGTLHFETTAYLYSNFRQTENARDRQDPERPRRRYIPAPQSQHRSRVSRQRGKRRHFQERQ